MSPSTSSKDVLSSRYFLRLGLGEVCSPRSSRKVSMVLLRGGVRSRVKWSGPSLMDISVPSSGSLEATTVDQSSGHSSARVIISGSILVWSGFMTEPLRRGEFHTCVTITSGGRSKPERKDRLGRPGGVALVSAAAHQQATDGAVVPHHGPSAIVFGRSREKHGVRGAGTRTSLREGWAAAEERVGSSGCGPMSFPASHNSYRSGWNRLTNVSMDIFTMSVL
ncbi:hypothetical protein E2C01_022799 [Portunus trituberculatus]|uniref:Uncharacterized protein n=1 Tax=Portunus trituberculatus TaxID=210409 RepID=A0A5B7E823_PORTR|nr:hypothetical protein [Portunus trituberculatus]